MPTVPNRPTHEARLARVIDRANSAQRRRLVEAMGDPARVENIPATLWLELEREQAAVTGGPLAEVFLAAGAALLPFLRSQAPRAFTVPTPELLDATERYTMDRAAALAHGYIQHTRERLTAVQAKLDGVQGRLDTLADLRAEKARNIATGRELKDSLEAILSRERAEAVARTETTRGTTGGEDFVGNRFDAEFPEKSRVKIWRHRNRLVRGRHPCPICAQLVGTTQNEWQSINPAAAAGPPAHPRCDCAVEVMILTRDEIERLPTIDAAPRGSPQTYADAFKRLRGGRRPSIGGVEIGGARR